MAIQKYIQLDSGIVLPNAYIRITDGILSLDRGSVFVTVQTYADKQARDEGRPAVLIHEECATLDGRKPQVNAKYKINIKNANVGKGQVFKINIDKENSIELIEGTHITTDGTLSKYTKAIVEKLNKNDNFNVDFIASSDKEGVIEIDVVENGIKVGAKGNGLTFEGNAIVNIKTTEGQDIVLSDFEKYFSIEVMNKEGNNVIDQAYKFIKSLPRYKDGIDVL